MAEIIINGSEGRIEARYHQTRVGAPIAVVMHDHPEQGGSMNAKTTYALYRSFINAGYNVVRFNFRGVGRSEGSFNAGIGELSDAASVLDWLQANNPNAPECWVSGFDFGSWVAMQLLMRRPEIDRFIVASPPAGKMDFSFLAPCPVSGLFVYGSNDEIIQPTNVEILAENLMIHRNITITQKNVPNADHYFTDQLDKLILTNLQYIQDIALEKIQKAA